MKYKIKIAGTNSEGYPAGTIVYDCVKYDYGLSRDDTYFTKIEHVSVTLDPTGDYPSFTVPKTDLEVMPS